MCYRFTTFITTNSSDIGVTSIPHHSPAANKITSTGLPVIVRNRFGYILLLIDKIEFKSYIKERMRMMGYFMVKYR